MSELISEKAFRTSPYYSIKHSNYFAIYDSLLKQFQGKKITFVEIGVLDGGSLFMWRKFFGDTARIIGIDLNPEAIKWKEKGFEIFIGDQREISFWRNFFKEVGKIDILLDDGGHKNDQQIVTTLCALPNINDGGILIVEDTQTSFMKFGNFKHKSFINFVLGNVKKIHARCDDLNVNANIFTELVHSIEFYSGVCAIKINRTLCTTGKRVDNGVTSQKASDFRFNAEGSFSKLFRKGVEKISIDYPTDLQKYKHPRIYEILEKKVARFVLRSFKVPIRFVLNLFIKTINLINLNYSVNLIDKFENRK